MSEIRARLAVVEMEEQVSRYSTAYRYLPDTWLDALTPVVDALIAEAVAAEDKRGYDAFARLTADWRETLAAKDAEIQRLTDERDALAAAMPSEGADAALAYAVEKSSRERLERRIAKVLALSPRWVVNDFDHPAVQSPYLLQDSVRALLTEDA